VKEKVDVPTPMTFDDDMDMLNNDEAPLIKDGSPPPIEIPSTWCRTLSSRSLEGRVMSS
jgi:hypothetical protein